MDADDLRPVRAVVRRPVRDARLHRLHEGTSGVQRVVVGGGLPRGAGTARG